jgi:hypothetical protein
MDYITINGYSVHIETVASHATLKAYKSNPITSSLFIDYANDDRQTLLEKVYNECKDLAKMTN